MSETTRNILGVGSFFLLGVLCLLHAAVRKSGGNQVLLNLLRLLISVTILLLIITAVEAYNHRPPHHP